MPTNSLSEKNIRAAFFAMLTATLFMPVLIPSARLLYFAPFLVITFYQRPLLFCLWCAFGCGIILDLLTPYSRFGLHAINLCLCTALLYPQKQHFFSDEWSTLPLMTFFFSVLSTLFHLFLQTLFSHAIKITSLWILTDLLIMPFFDACFAFICLQVPAILFGKKQKKGKDYFV